MRWLLASLALVPVMAPGLATARPLAVIHARLWTAGEAPLADATVVMDGGKVLSIAAGAPPPADAEVIDAQGQPVTAGLVNAAAQLGLTEVSSVSSTRDAASNAHDLAAGFDVSLALDGRSSVIALARADGVTAALSYPGPSHEAPFHGLAALVELREGDDILDRPAAALVVSIGGGAWKETAQSRAAQWQLLEEELDHAARHGEHGGPHGHDHGPPDADHRALDAVVAGRVPLAVIADRESDIRHAARLADSRGIRVVIIGGAEAWRVADVLAAAHVAVVLDPALDLPQSFDALGSRLDNAAILAAAGVPIAFGRVGGAIEETYNAGLALREGAGLAVANGLPYAAAVKALTGGARAIWGAGDSALAPGARADLVVWDGDPLEPATNAAVVIVEGRRVSTETRQRALGERYLQPR